MWQWRGWEAGWSDYAIIKDILGLTHWLLFSFWTLVQKEFSAAGAEFLGEAGWSDYAIINNIMGLTHWLLFSFWTLVQKEFSAADAEFLGVHQDTKSGLWKRITLRMPWIYFMTLSTSWYGLQLVWSRGVFISWGPGPWTKTLNNNYYTEEGVISIEALFI